MAQQQQQQQHSDFIKKLYANHELLLTKISSLESIIAEKKILSNNSSNTSSVVNNNVDFDEEKQRLIQENQHLRQEIQRLTKRLTDMECQIKGDDQVLSMNDLKKCSLAASSSTTASVPSAPAATQKQEKPSKEDNKKPDQQQQKQQKENKKSDKQQKQQPKQQQQQPQKSKPESAKESNETASDAKAIDASRLDLRVGRIIECKKHPDADSLYVEQIECGEDKPRTVVSGLVKFIPLEEMQNRMVVVLCNLKPAKMRGIVSEAMVMCASTPERVEILAPPEGSVPGDRVRFDKYPGEPDQQLNPKKKIWEQIAPDLSTNDSLEACYKGDSFVVPGKGKVKSQTLKNVPVK